MSLCSFHELYVTVFISRVVTLAPTIPCILNLPFSAPENDDQAGTGVLVPRELSQTDRPEGQKDFAMFQRTVVSDRGEGLIC